MYLDAVTNIIDSSKLNYIIDAIFLTKFVSKIDVNFYLLISKID